MTTTNTTTTTTTTFDRSIFIAAVAAILSKSFEPGDAQDAAALAIPASLCTADERRVYCLLSMQLYSGDGKPATALAWRIRHAFEAGVIGAPSKARFAYRELSGDAIATAERETRQVQRRMASDRIAERQAKATERAAEATERLAEATERLAEGVETLLQVFVMNTGKGQDLADIKAAFAARTSARTEARAAEAKAAAEKAAAEAKAAAEKAAAKAA